MTFSSKALRRFWEQYNRLPEDIQKRAVKQFELFTKDPFHPSLHLKPVSGFWSVRVTEAYRALAIRSDNEFTWAWIGPHDEYDQIIRSS